MLFDGVNEYTGQKFWVCIDCGRSEPQRDRLPPSMMIAPQPLLDERKAEMN